MMTFRPYRDHFKTAAVLDRQRLGKQRVEAMQIMQACFAWVTGEQKAAGWASHPVVRMWAGQANPYLEHSCGQIHLSDLIDYHTALVGSWCAKGYRHSHDYRILPYRWLIELDPRGEENGGILADHPLPWPKKLEDQHKKILLRKDPEYYGKFWYIRPKVLRSVPRSGGEDLHA